MWDDVKDGYNFILEKTSGYLNWRYLDPRGGEHVAFQAVDDSKALGVIVIQISRDDGYLEG